jgi:hypothetical protein
MNIYRKVLCTFCAITVFFLCFQITNAAVRVRGYYRKDGTYVRPHYRSNPDGNFGNNWSTTGNINPYTGKRGTIRNRHSSSRSSTPTRFQSYSSSSSGLNSNALENKSVSNSKFTNNSYVSPDQKKRIKLANELKELGHTVDWRNHSYQNLLTLWIRAYNVNTLKRHGIDSEPLTHTIISDMASRARKAESLSSLGVEARWQKFSLEELNDIEKRLREGESKESVILDYFDDHKGDLVLTQIK